MRKKVTAILVIFIAAQVSFGDVWNDVARYNYGDEPNPCEQAETLLQETPSKEYGAIEARLIEVVRSQEATQTGKAMACRFLQQIGSERCIAPVARLLGDDVLGHYARLVLERLDSDKADAAMRAALEEVPERLKVGILGSLGNRRDRSAVPQAASLARSKNRAVAVAALEALGKIGGEQAAASLISLRVPKGLEAVRLRAMAVCSASVSGPEASRLCREVLAGPDGPWRTAALIRLAGVDPQQASVLISRALRGTDIEARRTVLAVVAGTSGTELTGAMLGLLGRLGPQRQAELITALATRGDRSALAGVMRHLASRDPVLRSAAVKAAAKLGDARIVKSLLAAADLPETEPVVTRAVAAMPGEAVDAVVVGLLKDKALGRAAMQAAIARGSATAVPVLFALLRDADAETRVHAWEALGALASDEQMDALVQAAAQQSGPDDLSAASQAIAKLFSRVQDRSAAFRLLAKHYEGAPDAIKGLILDLGAEMGDSVALELEKKALASRNGELYGRALRALARWPNPSAAEVLLAEATGAARENDRIVALRGYIRLAGLEKVRIPAARRLEMLRKAIPLAKRTQEKKQIITALQYAMSLDALRMLVDYMDQPELAAEAEVSAANLISNLWQSHGAEVAPIAAQLAESSNKAVAQKARQTLENIEKKKR